jgi:hypothetical protein
MQAGPFLRRGVVGAIVGCAACFGAAASHAATILKLDLGGTGPDVAMTAGGLLSTVNDGTAATTGDQNTAIEFTDFLNGIPDVTLPTASYTLTGLQAVGPANVFGSLVIQNFTGGTFSLYDSANALLLTGPLVNSSLSGVLGPPGTGAIFTTTFSTVTGGSLAPGIQPGSVAMSMNLTNVNGGAGFSVAGGGPQLNAFQADASVNISGTNVIPEPATCSLLLIGAVATLRARRRR